MQDKKIAIFVPRYKQYSETFIKAHIDFFKQNSIVFHEGLTPNFYNDTPIISKSIRNKVIVLFNKVFRGFNEKQLLSKRIKKIILKSNVKALLFEFGVTAAENISLIKSLSIPTFVCFHGADAFDKKLLKKYKQQYLELFKYSKYIFAVSKEMIENLIELGASRNKIIYNPYGPDNRFFAIDPKRLNCFLSVGRFVDKKAPFITILAFNELIKSGIDSRLVMIGDGNLLDSCRLLSKSLQLQDIIQFVGIANHDDIFQYYDEAFCFVLHSVTDINGSKEGTPVAILEASASSLPIISTYHSGIKEAVLNNETGLLVKEFDISGMANNMKKLILNKKMAREMGERGRKHINKNYSIENHLISIQEIIFESIEND